MPSTPDVHGGPADVIQRTRRALLSRIAMIVQQIAKLDEERVRATEQCAYVEQWSYDESRDRYVHPSGAEISGAVVRDDGSCWPLIDAWDEAQRAEAGQ